MASKLHVLIVGAGIGGLSLAMMLERAGISYQVFEKASEVKPLGSAITLGCIFQVLEQLGLYEEILEQSLPFGALHIYDESLNHKGTFWSRAPQGLDNEELYGDHARVLSRPDLMTILLKQVPAHKIHYSKRVLTTVQDENEVTIHCADKTSYTGSLLVGADGAYSSVRHNMYKKLQQFGKLPEIDATPLGCSFGCVVGVSDPVDPDKFPVVKKPFSEFEVVLAKEIPYTVWYTPMPKNRIGFLITQDLRGEPKDHQRQQNADVDKTGKRSEWEADAASNVLNAVRHMPCPFGGTLADILDKTPKEVISKVMLEDKFFTTWYSGRTVLLGDACHKMLPFAGQGANMGILSALELTNLLYDIEDNSQEEINRILKEYYDIRHGLAKWCVSSANQNGAMLHKKGMAGDVMRYLFLNWMPQWLVKRVGDSFNDYRPQLNFLPFVKLRGSLEARTSKPSRRIVPSTAV